MVVGDESQTLWRVLRRCTIDLWSCWQQHSIGQAYLIPHTCRSVRADNNNQCLTPTPHSNTTPRFPPQSLTQSQPLLCSLTPSLAQPPNHHPHPPNQITDSLTHRPQSQAPGGVPPHPQAHTECQATCCWGDAACAPQHEPAGKGAHVRVQCATHAYSTHRNKHMYSSSNTAKMDRSRVTWAIRYGNEPTLDS